MRYMKKKHLMKVLLVCDTHANYSHMHEKKKKTALTTLAPLFLFIYFFLMGCSLIKVQGARRHSCGEELSLITAGNVKKNK